MKIIFLSEVRYNDETALEGEVRNLPEDLANSFIQTGWAKKYERPVIKLPKKK